MPNLRDPKGVLTRTTPDFFYQNLGVAEGDHTLAGVGVQTFALYNNATTAGLMFVMSLLLTTDANDGFLVQSAFGQPATPFVTPEVPSGFSASAGAPFGLLYQAQGAAVSIANLDKTASGFNWAYLAGDFGEPYFVLNAGYSLLISNYVGTAKTLSVAARYLIMPLG